METGPRQLRAGRRLTGRAGATLLASAPILLEWNAKYLNRHCEPREAIQTVCHAITSLIARASDSGSTPSLSRKPSSVVPQFLLRRWTNAAGKLRAFAIRNGRLVSNDLAPKYTGFESGLYAVMVNALGISEDIIERKLFSPIDNDAAKPPNAASA